MIIKRFEVVQLRQPGPDILSQKHDAARLSTDFALQANDEEVSILPDCPDQLL